MRRALDRLMLDAHVVDQDGKPKYGLHSFRHFFVVVHQSQDARRP
jgi:hypothetical protein